MSNELAVFEGHEIRRVYDEKTETWWFSVVDIIQVLTQQPDFQTARKYWNKLKERLAKEGSQLVTDCHQLKMTATDGKQRPTDVATAETLLRLVQSVPSPKAEPIKLWLAKVGYERMQELSDPSRSLDRARETWQKHRPKSKTRTRSKNRRKDCHSSLAKIICLLLEPSKSSSESYHEISLACEKKFPKSVVTYVHLLSSSLDQPCSVTISMIRFRNSSKQPHCFTELPLHI